MRGRKATDPRPIFPVKIGKDSRAAEGGDDDAMRTSHAALLLLTITLFAGPLAPRAFADSTVLRVQATVRPYLQFSASQSVKSFPVTKADLDAGYIDLPRALQLRYQTNITEPLRFQVAATDRYQVLVAGQSGVVRLDEFRPGVWVQREFDIRVLLTRPMQAGVYPLRLSLTPVAY